MNALKYFSVGAVALTLVTTLAPTGSQNAEAATSVKMPQNLTWAGDRFLNYDMVDAVFGRDKVDWPVTVLFTNNADVNYVKNMMDGDWAPLDASSANQNYNLLNDGFGQAWDGDGGKKTTSCPALGDYANHYRAYGIGAGQHLYNTTLGYWVPATTHRDWSECSLSPKYDFSEGTEEKMTYWAGRYTAVANDKFNIDNNEPFRVEGNHTWQSNAYASTIHMP
jgi:hypothetical protein